MSNYFYNYIYLDPRKPGKYCYTDLNFSLLFEPFYVGKGKKSARTNRKFTHLANSSLKKNSHKNNKIKKILLNYNMRDFIFQINTSLSNADAIKNEILLISAIGRFDLNLGPLTNQTNGGEGVSSPSQELREKQSARWSGKNNPMYGKTQSPEHKALLQKINKGKPSSNKGKKLHEIVGSEEIALILRKNNSTRQKGKIGTFKNKKHTTESKQKMSEHRKANKYDLSVYQKSAETRRRLGNNKGAKNSQAKKYKIIDHNTNIIYELSGQITSWCKEKGFYLTLFLRFKDEGIITIEKIKNKYLGVRPQNAGIGINSCKRYLGFEIISL